MSRAFNPTFAAASATLMGYCEAPELPEIVLERLAVLSDKPVKLMCLVGNTEITSDAGTPRVEPGLYASDLFVKLLQAVRALDWELVLVIIEHALTPIDAATRPWREGMPYTPARARA